MPCDTVQITGIQLGKVDAALLEAAMASLDYQRYQWKLIGEEVQVRGQRLTDEDISAVKVAYSQQVVKQTANKFGWQLKQISPTQFVAVKR